MADENQTSEFMKRIAKAIEDECAGCDPRDFDCFLAAARAAVAAMREPTEAMISEARDRIWEFSPEYAQTTLDPKGEGPESAEGVAKRAWRAMIDASLMQR